MVRWAMRKSSGTSSQSSRISATWAASRAMSAPGRAHGHADIGLGQGRRVVDAVADHDHGVARGLVLLDDGDLVLRQEIGPVGDAQLLGQRRRRALVIAGQQLDAADAQARTCASAAGTSWRRCRRLR